MVINMKLNKKYLLKFWGAQLRFFLNKIIVRFLMINLVCFYVDFKLVVENKYDNACFDTWNTNPHV